MTRLTKWRALQQRPSGLRLVVVLTVIVVLVVPGTLGWATRSPFDTTRGSIHSNCGTGSAQFVFSGQHAKNHGGAGTRLLRATSNNNDNHDDPNSMSDLLESMNDRLTRLEKAAPGILESFWEPSLCSFSVEPGRTTAVSVTSTSFALQAMLAAPDQTGGLYSNLVTMDTRVQRLEPGDPRTPVSRILQALWASEWRQEDLFQAPVLLNTILQIHHHNKRQSSSSLLPLSMDEVTASRLQKLVQGVLSARPRRRRAGQQPYSDYIVFQCAQVYAQLYDAMSQQQDQSVKDSNRATKKQESALLPEKDTEMDYDEDDPVDYVADGFYSTSSASSSTAATTTVAGLPPSAVPEGLAPQLSLALTRCAEISSNELCRQLALRGAGDTNDFDVMRLVYSLLTYVAATRSLAGTAGRELVPGQGPAPGTRVRPVNPRLVQAGLKAFFEEQTANGLWDKGQPIYRSFRRTGRNVGNAFIFATDTVASLLQWLEPSLFRPYLGQLERTLEWIEVHQLVEILPDYCDLESGQCYGKALYGWSSPHLSPETGPQAWSTAQTVACISRLKTTIETLRHEDVLAEFGGVVQSTSTAAWDRLLDSDLGDVAGGGRTLKDVLAERVIDPRADDPSAALVGLSYSAILFGPPGTAKTTICEALAQRIGWDFVVIDTSVFLADGLTNVASRIRYVFRRLQALRNCVILFDEIEEFCLNREAPGIGMESRMLTTAMLTAINDLRRAKKSIFFLATNRLRAFDAAITRPGRFDMQLFVGTPNLQARQIQFRQQLANVAATVDADTKQQAVDAYTEFLARHWEQNAKYMNYLEGMQFAAVCAQLVAKGAAGGTGSFLTEEAMAKALASQAAVMTVRGTVREEFDKSMELTRL